MSVSAFHPHWKMQPLQLGSNRWPNRRKQTLSLKLTLVRHNILKSRRRALNTAARIIAFFCTCNATCSLRITDNQWQEIFLGISEQYWRWLYFAIPAWKLSSFRHIAILQILLPQLQLVLLRAAPEALVWLSCVSDMALLLTALHSCNTKVKRTQKGAV